MLLVLSFNLSAQMTAITEVGDTIKVYENGTWERLQKNVEIASIETSVETTVEVDEFDNTKKIFTTSWGKFGVNATKNVVSGSLVRIADLLAFTINYSGDLGCLSEYSSTMKVKLTNGNVIEFAQISDTDCGDYPSAKFIPLTKEQQKDPNYKDIVAENIDQLRNFDWVTIRLQGSKYYTDLTPHVTKKVDKPEQFFRQHIIASDLK